MRLMILGCITYEGMGTLTIVNGNINASKFIDIIENNVWPIIARHFTNNEYIYQDDNALSIEPGLLKNISTKT